MGKQTAISWTDATFNPWWGCQKVSPGCTHCYAETFAKRVGQLIWGPPAHTDRRLFGDKHWREPLQWNEKAKAEGVRRRVFCASMADWAELHPQVTESRARLFETIRETPWLDWLLLTKRPEYIGALLPPGYWSNVWLGTTAEDQEYADLRTPELLKYRDRAPVLFLSVEPQIGPVTFRWRPWAPLINANHLDGLRQLDWIIVGGESGGHHRPFDVDWARNLRDECREAGVAFHFKQHGGLHAGAGGCDLDGQEIKEFPNPRQLVAA